MIAFNYTNRNRSIDEIRPFLPAQVPTRSPASSPVFQHVAYGSPSSEEELRALLYLQGLTPDDPVITSRSDYDREVQRLFKEKSKESNLSLVDLLPYRIKTAYRLTRFLAKQLQLIHEDEPLSSIKSDQIQALHLIPDDLRRQAFIDATAAEAPQVSIWPPSPPQSLEADFVDNKIIDYVKIITHLSDCLGMSGINQSDRYGLAGILDYHTCRMAFPSYYSVIKWENFLIRSTLKTISTQSLLTTYDHLETEYGFTEQEAKDLIQLTRIKAAEFTEEDIEDAKALAILKLDEISGAAADSLDVRAQIAALKNKALIQGLTADTGDNTMKEFLRIAQEHNSNERKAVESSTVNAGLLNNGE